MRHSCLVKFHEFSYGWYKRRVFRQTPSGYKDNNNLNSKCVECRNCSKMISCYQLSLYLHHLQINSHLVSMLVLQNLYGKHFQMNKWHLMDIYHVTSTVYFNWPIKRNYGYIIDKPCTWIFFRNRYEPRLSNLCWWRTFSKLTINLCWYIPIT